MDHLTAHRLRFITRVRDTVELDAHQGSAIRGALFHALRRRFCALVRDGDVECAACPLAGSCPVAFLVSTLRPGSGRGRDVPRPYTIQPPLPGSGCPTETADGRPAFRYRPGERFEFGLTLYARAMDLFPYVVLAGQVLEEGGIGRRTRQENGRMQRGRLTIQEIRAENPLTGAGQSVLRQGEHMVQVPDMPITHRQVLDQPLLRAGRVRLHLLTPTRLVDRGGLLKPDQFQFRPFLHRLVERIVALSRHFTDTPLDLREQRPLIEQADTVRLVENGLHWTEVHSYSSRRRERYPVSGLLGSATLEAEDWIPFWPWLVWGQFTHVGKDAVKGNGWYRLEVTDGHYPPPDR